MHMQMQEERKQPFMILSIFLRNVLTIKVPHTTKFRMIQRNTLSLHAKSFPISYRSICSCSPDLLTASQTTHCSLHASASRYSSDRTAQRKWDILLPIQKHM